MPPTSSVQMQKGSYAASQLQPACKDKLKLARTCAEMAQSMSRQSLDDMTGSNAARPLMSSLLRLQRKHMVDSFSPQRFKPKVRGMNLRTPKPLGPCVHHKSPSQKEALWTLFHHKAPSQKKKEDLASLAPHSPRSFIPQAQAQCVYGKLVCAVSTWLDTMQQHT